VCACCSRCGFCKPPDFVEQGRKALDANHNEEAAGLFRKAVEADPKDYAAHFHLALSETLLQHDPEAIAEYRKTLELHPIFTRRS